MVKSRFGNYDLIKVWLGWNLWKIWKSLGMIIPNIWENKKWQPNHQPEVNIVTPNAIWIHLGIPSGGYHFRNDRPGRLLFSARSFWNALAAWHGMKKLNWAHRVFVCICRMICWMVGWCFLDKTIISSSFQTSSNHHKSGCQILSMRIILW